MPSLAKARTEANKPSQEERRSFDVNHKQRGKARTQGRREQSEQQQVVVGSGGVNSPELAHLDHVFWKAQRFADVTGTTFRRAGTSLGRDGLR